jgi:hypothetical protein
MVKTTITVDPSGAQGAAFKKALEGIDDLRIPLELIRESWFKGNRSIFAIGGPGKWADLTEGYKKAKQRKKGFIYPILYSEGVLKNALTVMGDKGSISKLIGKKSLDLGVDPSNKVFGYLHYGTSKMKARPYVLLGAEQVAPSGLNNRTEAWRKLIIDYVIQKSQVIGGR